jgi:hypothetical protein
MRRSHGFFIIASPSRGLHHYDYLLSIDRNSIAKRAMQAPAGALI